jgi:hypothetical protein
MARAAGDVAQLATELDELAPRFGRAREGVEALAARARAGDAHGVVREARRVADEIERALGGHLPAHARGKLASIRKAPGGPAGAAAAAATAIALLRWYAEAVPETAVAVAAPAPERRRSRAALVAAGLVAAVALVLAVAAVLVRRASG